MFDSGSMCLVCFFHCGTWENKTMILTTKSCRCVDTCNCPVNISDLPKMKAFLPSLIKEYKEELAITPRRHHKRTAFLKWQLERFSGFQIEVDAALKQVCA